MLSWLSFNQMHSQPVVDYTRQWLILTACYNCGFTVILSRQSNVGGVCNAGILFIWNIIMLVTTDEHESYGKWVYITPVTALMALIRFINWVIEVAYENYHRERKKRLAGKHGLRIEEVERLERATDGVFPKGLLEQAITDAGGIRKFRKTNLEDFIRKFELNEYP